MRECLMNSTDHVQVSSILQMREEIRMERYAGLDVGDTRAAVAWWNTDGNTALEDLSRTRPCKMSSHAADLLSSLSPACLQPLICDSVCSAKPPLWLDDGSRQIKNKINHFMPLRQLPEGSVVMTLKNNVWGCLKKKEKKIHGVEHFYHSVRKG